MRRDHHTTFFVSPASLLRRTTPRGPREALSSPDPEEYVELVLSVVEEIPWGRVTSYGAIAGVVGGGPRQVGAVMARHGGPVPWWRVVRADGSLPPSHEENARPHYLDEATPLRPSGAVDMAAAFWEPEPPPPLAAAEG